VKIKSATGTSVTDPDPYPDPHSFGRLNPDPNLHWEYGSSSRRAKMTDKSEENSSF
jgi:hypothetical protein